MNEQQKIEKILERYKDFFETTTADISLSHKGRRFFFLTDRKCGDLYGLAEFTTADELERLILIEMVDQITMRLETFTEDMSDEVKRLDVSYSAFDFNKVLIELHALLSVIKNEMGEHLPEILSFVKGISTYINENGETEK